MKKESYIFKDDLEALLYKKAYDYGTIQKIDKYLEEYPNGNNNYELLQFKAKVIELTTYFLKINYYDAILKKYNKYISLIIILIILLIRDKIDLFKGLFILDNPPDPLFFLFIILIAVIGMFLIYVSIEALMKYLIKIIFSSKDIFYIYKLLSIDNTYEYISLNFIEKYKKVNKLKEKIFIFNIVVMLISVMMTIVVTNYFPEKVLIIGFIPLAILYFLGWVSDGGGSGSGRYPLKINNQDQKENYSKNDK